MCDRKPIARIRYEMCTVFFLLQNHSIFLHFFFRFRRTETYISLFFGFIRNQTQKWLEQQ